MLTPLQSLLWAMRRAGLNPTEPEMMVNFKSNFILFREWWSNWNTCVLLGILFQALKDMINHIDEHNTGILDFPAFYSLVKKKSCDQVKYYCKILQDLKSTVSRTQKITSRMHSGLSARTPGVGVLNANFRVHNWICPLDTRPHVKIHDWTHFQFDFIS